MSLNLISPLGNVAEIVAGITLGRKTESKALINTPYLRVANVQDGYIDLSEVKQIAATSEEIEKLRLKSGDILLTEGGDLDKLGRGSCWQDHLPICIHQNHIFRVRLPLTSYDPEYVSFQIGSPYGKAYFLKHAKKTTGIATINQKVLRAFPLLSPPLPLQRQIAARLRAQLAEVETSRRAAKTQVRDASLLPDAVYREAFRAIIPIAVPPVLPQPPSRWDWRKLTNVARLESGHTPSRLRSDWWGGDISWLSLSEIRALDGTWVDQTQLRTNADGIANSAARILPRGTVCLSRTASVGFVAIMGNPMATSQDFANWVCGDDLDPDFLMHALICSRTSLRDMASGATHKTIYMPALASFQICAPGIAEQKRIVKRLRTQLELLHAVRAALTAQDADISALPQRILAQTFGT